MTENTGSDWTPASRPASRWGGLLLMGAGLLVGLAAGLVAFFGVPQWPGGAAASAPGGAVATPAPAPVVGAPAPDFTLKDLAGKDVTLSSFRGRVVLLNFWATWCGPCRFEMPAIEQRYEKYESRSFVVLAVDLDEPAADVSAFVQSFGLTFPVLLDPGAGVNDLYRVRGYPTTFFLDGQGTITQKHIGAMTKDQLDGSLSRFGLSGS